MIRSRAHRRFVAWLAIAAMWLMIVAPAVSRTLPAAWSMPDLGAWCGDHNTNPTHPSSPQPHDFVLEKCGYCGLLSDSPTLTGAAWHPPILPPVVAMPHGRVIALPGMRHSELAAAPRGPPAFVHA
ncbi:DUF2946 family protein [Dyella soli]|uniref:DUF2946 domain-containing protein n=1 Tax=Dyella soli TaxID=522319 RepID=A0A4R0YND3_9GAMM|nr:DUF2946 family protein [Dyella soli]TCI07329.1 DUF2946 domain-containing protein [Dyella soli]